MTVISEHWCNGLATAAGMLEDGEVTASIVGVTELMRDDGAAHAWIDLGNDRNWS